MENLAARAQSFGEGRHAFGHDHELLKIDRRIRVRAAVDDVHHRYRQHLGIRSAEVFEKREAELVGGRPCSRKRDRENRIRAELALVRRAVERDHRLVHVDLIERVHVRHFFSDDFVHIRHSFRHAAAKEAFFHAIAQLPRLMFPCASAARDNGIAGCAAGDSDDSFNSWITARIDDLPGVDSNDFRHGHNRCSSF